MYRRITSRLTSKIPRIKHRLAQDIDHELASVHGPHGLQPGDDTYLDQMNVSAYDGYDPAPDDGMDLSRPTASIYDAHVLSSGDSTNIRVIEILPDDTKDADMVISCKLHVVSLDDAPAYRALSYMWGDESRTKNIVLDGTAFAVRENLFSFLAQYRSSGDKSYMWIDALCIDQSCVKERNHQVALMGNIYSKAGMVIAWLGDNYSYGVQPITTLNHRHIMTNYDVAIALCQISRNHYWSRLWIVQEFVLCDHLEVWSVYARMDGEVFCELLTNGLNHLRHKMVDDELSVQLGECCRSEASTVASYRSENRRMDAFRNDFIFSKCSDRRDRIYGLLGVLDEKERRHYPIVPDYSKAVITLFLEVWIMWLKAMVHRPEFELKRHGG